MSVTQEWIICSHKWPVYKIGTWIPFSKQYRCVTNHLHLYVSNCYIIVCIVTPLTAYYVPLSCQYKYLPKYSIYNYCNIWQNQHRFHGPISILTVIPFDIFRHWKGVVNRGYDQTVYRPMAFYYFYTPKILRVFEEAIFIVFTLPVLRTLLLDGAWSLFHS